MERIKELTQKLLECGKNGICLAFSGGVDSAVLLKLAVDAGLPVLAVTFHTMLHPAADLEQAKKLAKQMGAPHWVLPINEFQNPKVMENPPDRCYHCKFMLFEQLADVARDQGLGCIMDGTNFDDLGEYRPGLRALQEWNVHSPLAECHVTKAEVREIAAKLGLSVASKPSAPCMATRFPYGDRFTRESLEQVERAEAQLKELGFYNVRVRCHRGIARIEVDKKDLGLAVQYGEEIVSIVKSQGFDYVTLDLEGFRSGSMDLHVQREKVD